MAANEYHRGQVVRVTGTFTVGGTATDPTTITIKYRDPDELETSDTFGDPGSDVVKDATGVYYLDITASKTGSWWYRVEGTGNAAAGAEDTFFVKETHF